MRKILYSPGFGAGWTSWNDEAVRKLMLEYQPIIEFIERGGTFTYADCHDEPLHPLLKQLQNECETKFGVPYICVLGASSLKVAEVDGQVRIKEYDGSESYVTRDTDDPWL